SLLDWREWIEAVHLIDVDVIGAKPAQACLARAQEVMARVASIVGSRAHRERGFGRDNDLVTLAGDGFAENLFRHASGVHVGRVEHVHVRLETDVDKARRFPHVGLAPGAEELAAAAKRSGTEAEHRDLET